MVTTSSVVPSPQPTQGSSLLHPTCGPEDTGLFPVLNITWVSSRVCVMSHNSECESDHIAVREKAAVDTLEKQVLRGLGADAVSDWGARCEEICCPRAKWAVLSFPKARQNALPVCLCVYGCTGVHGWGKLCVCDVGSGQPFVGMEAVQ